MKRLTKRMGGISYSMCDNVIIAKCENCTHRQPSCYDEDCQAELDVTARLAAYEDTGLTPEQVEELAEKATPKPAIPRISEGLAEIGNVHFGKGVTIWNCPSCEIFLTPTHEYCWKCGQHLTFKFSDEPRKEE